MKAGGNNLGAGAVAGQSRPLAQTNDTVASTDTDTTSSETLAPLYERLPRGPHQLGADVVAENQRRRMHGAMVEAVAANGYGGTSVKQVVTLAPSTSSSRTSRNAFSRRWI